MSNCNNQINEPPDVVVIGGGTSGLMFALGAIHCGLKVILITSTDDFRQSSLLTKEIPNKVFCHIAKFFSTVKQANSFGLELQYKPINLHKVNAAIINIIKQFKPEEDLELFKILGGSIIIGKAKFINKHQVLVNNMKIASKYFVIAAGTREYLPNIININKNDFLAYKQLFCQHNIPQNPILLGGRQESLEIAQALARFGSKVTVIFEQEVLFPHEDQEMIQQLINHLTSEGIDFYCNTKILAFERQNHRKLLTCSNHYGERFIVSGDEIINLQKEQPNIEELGLATVNIHHTKDGILVNKKLQTTQKNIFALGSIAKTLFKSVHLFECQTNVILNNIAFHLPKKINYTIIPRILYTDPQLAAVGINTYNVAKKDAQLLKFKFTDIDAAIYQQQTLGEIKLIHHDNKILGVSIMGEIAAEIINEYTFAMQVEADLTEIANTVHPYHSLSLINKRAANKFFDQKINEDKINMGKIMYKFHAIFAKITTVIE